MAFKINICWDYSNLFLFSFLDPSSPQVFFSAGFETSSTTLSYCLYELAKNQNIQKRVQSEIDRVLKQHNGQLSYEALSEMVYLEKCIDGE